MVPTLDRVCYTTRERVQLILDQADTVRLNSRIDECIAAASFDAEGELHRRFYPTVGVRYPDPHWVQGSSLWINNIDHEVISTTSLVVDGTTFVQGTDFYLDPDRGSPPYNVIRLYRESSQAWSTDQRSIVHTGVFGGSNSTMAAGDLAANISSTTATSMTITDSSLIGVGDLVLIDSERVLVTEKSMVDSTATVSGAVASSMATSTVPVSDGTKVIAGEYILVGSERMFVESVTGNNLTVKRAQQGSVLAAHASPDVVYVPRVCTIVRAMYGTTAATHTSGADLARNKAPALVSEFTTALTLNYLEQGKAAYARTVGSGDAERVVNSGGAGLKDIRDRAYYAHGRRGRVGAC